MGLGTLMVGLGAYAWYQSADATEEEEALARLYAEDAYDPYGYGGIEPGAGFGEPPVNPFAAPAANPLGAPTDAPRYAPIGDSPTQGPADALVTIVVFADYQCPFCGRVLPTLAQIRENYGDDVRIVYKNNPLPFHQEAMPAAELALEARAQRGDSGFFEAHEALYASQRGLGRADLERIATALGLDASRTRRALDSRRHRPTIQRDIDLATQIGAAGTPNFFINGHVVRGAQPYAEFSRVIEEQRTMANLLVASGVPRGDVYEALLGAARR
ncbi:MAG: DsbA family protein [Deltaproteobacteria bacterium]|nr:DsbA family protein [Deltaproteobacteria bacterium]